MLAFLAARGEIAIVRRKGGQRLWDLAERWFPETEPLADEGAGRCLVRQRLKSRGMALRALVEQPQVMGYTRQRLTCPDMVRNGLAVPVSIDGVVGDWVADPEALTTMTPASAFQVQ